MNELKTIDPVDWEDWIDPSRFSPKPQPKPESEHQLIGVGGETYPRVSLYNGIEQTRESVADTDTIPLDTWQERALVHGRSVWY